MAEHFSDCAGSDYPGPRYVTSFGRRSFIQVGLLGGFGLSLADLLRAGRASVNRGERAEGRAKSVIQITLPGGIAHQESRDPKPESPIGRSTSLPLTAAYRLRHGLIGVGAYTLMHALGSHQ